MIHCLVASLISGETVILAAPSHNNNTDSFRVTSRGIYSTYIAGQTYFPALAPTSTPTTELLTQESMSSTNATHRAQLRPRSDPKTQRRRWPRREGRRGRCEALASALYSLKLGPIDSAVGRNRQEVFRLPLLQKWMTTRDTHSSIIVSFFHFFPLSISSFLFLPSLMY